MSNPEKFQGLRSLPRDGHLKWARDHRLGHGKRPAGDMGVLGGGCCCCVCRPLIAFGPGQCRVGQQGASEHRWARWLSVVGSTARPGHELLGLVCCVEEAALAISEVRQRCVQQLACQVQPSWVTSGLVQGEQAFGQVAVVVGDFHGSSDHALA